MKGRGRRIFVDAHVGRGAADLGRAERGERVDARARAFAKSLKAMHDARHVAVFSPSLWKEWRNHARRGSTGRRWLIRMGDRGLLVTVEQEPDATWLQEVIAEHLPECDRHVAVKDSPLVASALVEADDRLLSGDDKAREKYVRLAGVDARLSALHWVNPSLGEARKWLLKRAPDDVSWTLGAEARG